MINVTVRSAMHIAEALGGIKINVTINTGSDISGLLSQLSEIYGEAFSKHIYKDGEVLDGHFAILLNGCSIATMKGLDTQLADSDNVFILPPIAGG